MDTTVYFIRHSVRFKNTELIESYRTDQSELLKNEKIILSVIFCPLIMPIIIIIAIVSFIKNAISLAIN